MIADRQLGLLAENHLEILQPSVVGAKLPVAYRRPRFTIIARFGEAEVNSSAGGKIGRQQHFQQTALAFCIYLRHTGDRRRKALARQPEP
ncbi:hypothetical protein D3C80_1016640 [compost metagenome]